LDEPTKGLAPLVIEELISSLVSLSERITILLVEQNLEAARQISEKFVVIDEGQTVAYGDTDELGAEAEIVEKYLIITPLPHEGK
jgi:branched-chain amino acid transport system ATP-binding protein